MTEHIRHFLKGLAMGAANVVPGVSGGTVAFIAGIYERLIQAVAHIDLQSFRLLFRGRIRELAARLDLTFLVAVGAGSVAGILTLARILRRLLESSPVMVWAFFFGLILASVWFVGRRVRAWGLAPGVAVLIGAAIAAGVAILSPGSENASLPYLLISGAAATASMIIPGLSGSFVLLLLGNYELIMIRTASQLSSLELEALRILIPVGIGGVLGLLALGKALNWLFRRYHDLAVATLTGFVAGSLLLIWPWKTPVMEAFAAEDAVKEKVVGYQWHLPDATRETGLALGLMAAGAALVWGLERAGARKEGG